MFKKVLFVLALLVFFMNIAIATASAGWVDDWIDQRTYTSPDYYEGQKRGYYAFGSFSGRWRSSNDYLFSVMPPKLKTGCGGIDAFMGGFSFLDFDYLVQKLQNILQAAPAAAFDIALKTLCEPCENSITKLEGMANQLNSIQIDDCKASQALAVQVVKPFTDDKSGDLAAMEGDYMQSSGLEDLWQTITENREANNDNPQVNQKDMLSKCPQDIKDVFGTDGSVLGNLGGKLGIDSQYTDLIRGLVGDVLLVTSGNNFTAHYVSPCDKNDPTKVDDFIEGKTEKKDLSGNCQQIDDTNRNISKYVQDKMLAIASKMKNGQSPSSEDIAFIEQSPLPISLVLKTAVGTEQEASVIATLSDVTAKAYSFQMLSDLYNKAFIVIEKAKELVSSQQGADAGSKAYECKIEITSDAREGLFEIQRKTFELLRNIRAYYAASATEVNTILSLVTKMKTFDDIARETLSQRFGSAVAKRALGGNS